MACNVLFFERRKRRMKAVQPLVLIAENDSDQSELMCDAVVESGCRVETAASASEVLKKAADFPPDLLVLDADLPGLSSLQLLDRLHVRKATRSLPVILVSSFGRGAETQAFSDAIIAALLFKPLDADEFQKSVRMVLKKVACVPDSNRG
jgi:DNA-binding response OmpR family regulator